MPALSPRPAIESTPFQLSPIKAIEIAASKVPGSVSLAQGIPSFSTPDVIREFVFDKVRAGLCDKYSLTTGLSELREEISLSLEKDGIRADPENEIIVTAGSIEGITATILALTEPGDEVLIPSPTYTSYAGAIYVARCTPRFVALDEERNFEFRLETLERSITKKTKLLLFSSPNNPTGTIFGEENTRGLCAFAERHNLTLLIDEVYKDFYYNDLPHFSPAHVSGMRNRVVRVCSFSKAYSMTGWRVGFLHSNDKTVATILKYHDAMVTCAPVVSQYAALAALRFGEPFLKSCQKILADRRRYTLARLDEVSQRLDYQVPQAAYFAFPRIKDTVPLARDSFRLAYDILEKTGLALVPGAAFGPTGESHLRITFGRSDEELRDGLARFADYLTNKAAPRGSDKVQATVQRATSPSLTRSIAAAALRWSAQGYLRRTHPQVIGIVGSRGKTTVKRLIGDALRTRAKTRMTMLSYNTTIGLPLSVLDLAPPRTTAEKIRFALQLVSKALVESGDERFLVLEYGIANADDAERLASVVRPDWLIVTGIAQLDPSLPAEDFLAGVRHLCKLCGPSKILYPADEPRLKDIGLALAPDLALSLTSDDSPSTDLITESAKLGAAAAAKLLSLL